MRGEFYWSDQLVKMPKECSACLGDALGEVRHSEDKSLELILRWLCEPGKGMKIRHEVSITGAMESVFAALWSEALKKER